jgi:hypothetical protein
LFSLEQPPKIREKTEKEKKQEQDLYTLFGVSMPLQGLDKDDKGRYKASIILPRTSSISRENDEDNRLSPKSEKIDEDQDIMDIQDIRSKCIRVYGWENQTHIISVLGIETAAAIRKKIYLKFNINEATGPAELFISGGTDKTARNT